MRAVSLFWPMTAPPVVAGAEEDEATCDEALDSLEVVDGSDFEAFVAETSVADVPVIEPSLAI